MGLYSHPPTHRRIRLPTATHLCQAFSLKKSLPKTKKVVVKITDLPYLKTMKNEMTYNEMFAKFNVGKITEQEWKAFCLKVLCEVMEENKDVLIRLKNR